LIVGRSANTDDALEQSIARGILTPQTDGLVVNDAHFYNFDWVVGNAAVAAFGLCGDCSDSASAGPGRIFNYTVRLQGNTVDRSTVTRIFDY